MRAARRPPRGDDMSHVKRRLGEILREQAQISEEELDHLIEEQRQNRLLLGELLLHKGVIAKDVLTTALEQVVGCGYVDSCTLTPDRAALNLVPRKIAQQYCALPYALDARKLLTVMAQPQNLNALGELRFISGADIAPRLGFEREIREAIERCYDKVETPSAVERTPELPILDGESGGVRFAASRSAEKNRAAGQEFEEERHDERNLAVRLTSAVLAKALAKNASDVHIEPQARGTVVRIRVDGMLRELTQVPGELQNALVSRIKVLSDMDIAERRAPQDGGFLVQVGDREVDVRVSTLPTHYGEKVVLRLLDSTLTSVTLTGLGLSEPSARQLSDLLSRPQGMVIVTGPTGAGKTTLLYAALNALRSPEMNVVTVEDPIEYRIEGINQVQVNPKAGLTFAACLRSILRQDPNVLMVGEIRDAETAEIALQAAQTGHLVLTTLHTNDSFAAVARLLDLNVPPFLIAPSLNGVTAQRLVRKLCECRAEVEMTPDRASRLRALGANHSGHHAFQPVGCKECDFTGFHGRVGIYEMLVFDEQVRDCFREKAPSDEIRALARKRGMRRMQEDALDKVSAGITTLEEVRRVVPCDDPGAAVCRRCGVGLGPMFLFCPYCGAAARHRAGEPEAANPAGEGVR